MLQTKEIMEEFRGLLNLESHEGKLITFVFFGLSEIEQNLKLDEPLAQRVAVRVSLEAMDIEEAKEYIHHRLSSAGSNNIPFTKEAISIIYRYSNGIPRLINVISDNALLEAFLLKKKVVDEELLVDVLEDLGFHCKDTPVTIPSSSPKTIVNDLPAKSPELDDLDLIFQGLETK